MVEVRGGWLARREVLEASVGSPLALSEYEKLFRPEFVVGCVLTDFDRPSGLATDSGLRSGHLFVFPVPYCRTPFV